MKTKSDTAPLIDIPAFKQRLHGIAGEMDKASPQFRPAVVAQLRQCLEHAHEEAERRLIADGEGTRCAERLSQAEDELIRELFELANNTLYPASANNEERISIVAVGGYGRGTLAPGSDIDLLFLLPVRQSDRVQSIVEFILYCLWDARQKVGPRHPQHR
jgi:[protein-PII] uridylyltransferase